MTYDLTPYVTDVDKGWLWTRVTWTPRDGGDTLTAESDYVGTEEGTAELGCGIEQAADDLGMLHVLDDSEHYLMLCDLINKQLRYRPWAILHCPEGTARLELIPPPPR
ncbi:hypothetical protein [Mycobacteroides abscessus]|uniref:hypothetical protein n=1 Tax=Mycobacteroides abscessus TaxID=36809 RepID=UPI0009277EC0|nr:hypothetical protein [Mycobacteroides abscessus]SHP99108.1 Uncharacterised protein [Mycobacteroides abscessus subsp. abscessus]SHQ61682.1 Uncharacterised protein [Mycobacteroides abscessus subsp. abscessus]SKD62846.1 Uncharacterised protein [Mycobacteroides abscessus subsp. abscessus]SLD63332.1 Uncharacterised protein [Mycobacteroides abscessus subsp. abscessus]